MSAPPYMQLYVADYLGDTRHLTAEQHGAYLLLLMTMWRSDGVLPDDDQRLARMAACTPSRWAKIKADVLAFFTPCEGGFTQPRLAAELEIADRKAAQRSQSGKLGGRAKALKDKKASVANDKRSPCHSPEPEPEDTPSPLNLAPLSRLLALASEGSFAETVAFIHDAQPKTRGKRKTTTPDVRDALAAAIKRGGSVGEIRRAVAAYYALPDCKRDEGQFSMGAKVLLAKDRWREFLPVAAPYQPPSPALIAHRLQHFSKTGEWKPAWGPKPANDATDTPLISEGKRA